jgi:GATA-binding protein, other eukaryote
MDGLAFDPYASYSDSSAPRTPSPRVLAEPHVEFKNVVEVPNIFQDQQEEGVHPEYYNPYMQHQQPQPAPRGSLLQELYDHDSPGSSTSQEIYPEEHLQHQQQQAQQQWPSPARTPSGEQPIMRRATFPYVRQDQGYQQSHYPPYPQQHQQPPMDAYLPHHPPYPSAAISHEGMYHSPPGAFAYPEDEAVKVEDAMMHGYYAARPGSSSSSMSGGYSPPPHHQLPPHLAQGMGPMGSPPGVGLGMPPAYLNPHTGLPVQHTDDAASKETQYLRRRCHNCHTTEPPSWRRSTLNPGKIVCNKCGLYERTHLRPRPLRFDELRAGNRARKQAAAAAAAAQGVAKPPPAIPTPSAAAASIAVQGVESTSPVASPKAVKKEQVPESPALTRRASISSNSSSVHSGSGASDWDDSCEYLLRILLQIKTKTIFPLSVSIFLEWFHLQLASSTRFRIALEGLT